MYRLKKTYRIPKVYIEKTYRYNMAKCMECRKELGKNFYGTPKYPFCAKCAKCAIEYWGVETFMECTYETMNLAQFKRVIRTLDYEKIAFLEKYFQDHLIKDISRFNMKNLDEKIRKFMAINQRILNPPEDADE